MSAPLDSTEITTGTKIGRFVVEGQLGAGGMGVVFAAHDRELDRRVALKVLRGADIDEQQRMRLLREGQAMARVTHENVIVVHEVGIAGKLVFLAQELLDGGSLRQWLETPRPQREILEKFLAAGRGLAAAHRAGLVHRDFKPDNVLLGNDGRVRVSDFGLARTMTSSSLETTVPMPTGVDALAATTNDLARSPMATMTRTGAVMGTPLYMSPEQHAGEPADARSDQFSFCVALYQALYGEVPFAGKTAVALADAVLSGRIQPPPRGARVSARLRKILLRGLATRPADRYSSMDVMLAELARDRGRAARRLALGVGIAAVIAGAVAGGYALRSPHEQPEALAKRAVAVLGFKNLSGDAALDWISSAMSELLASEIAGDEVRVASAEDAQRARADLALPSTESFSAETLARIRDRLGVDTVVSGSYLQTAGEVKLIAIVEDVHRGKTTRLEVSGTPGDLPALAAAAGAQIRDALGVTSLQAAKRVHAVLPRDPAAARAYVEGTAALRAFDHRRAKDRLLAATEREPDFAPGHVALAEAYEGLFDAAAAHAAARRALATAQALPIDQQLAVATRAHDLLGERGQARDHARRLFAMHPDNLDYGLALVRLQPPADAVATVARLRAIGGDDPRLDVAEARAELERPDAPRALELARRASTAARARNAGLVLAEARRVEGDALVATGELAAAREPFEEARKRFDVLGDRLRALEVLEALAALALERGLLDDAFAQFDAAAALREQAGQRERAAAAAASAAHAVALRGDLGAAEPRAREAGKAAGGDPVAVPTVDLALATIARARGDLRGGLLRAESCVARATGTVPGLAARCAHLRGELHADLGDVAAARAALADGRAHAERAGNALRDREIELALAQLDLDTAGDDDTVAARVAGQAAAIQHVSAARGATELEARAWIALARAHLVQAESQQALAAIEKVGPRVQALRLEVERAVVEGLTHHELGDSVTAREKIDAARAQAEQRGWPLLVLEARFARARVLPADERQLELDAVIRAAAERGFGRLTAR